jgi:hypothetical protein
MSRFCLSKISSRCFVRRLLVSSSVQFWSVIVVIVVGTSKPLHLQLEVLLVSLQFLDTGALRIQLLLKLLVQLPLALQFLLTFRKQLLWSFQVDLSLPDFGRLAQILRVIRTYGYSDITTMLGTVRNGPLRLLAREELLQIGLRHVHRLRHYKNSKKHC